MLRQAKCVFYFRCVIGEVSISRDFPPKERATRFNPTAFGYRVVFRLRVNARVYGVGSRVAIALVRFINKVLNVSVAAGGWEALRRGMRGVGLLVGLARVAECISRLRMRRVS